MENDDIKRKKNYKLECGLSVVTVLLVVLALLGVNELLSHLDRRKFLIERESINQQSAEKITFLKSGLGSCLY